MSFSAIPPSAGFLPGAAHPAQTTYTLTLPAPVFNAISSLRQKLKARLTAWLVPDTSAENMLLSVSEILTNLVKHPERKASFVQVHLRQESGRLVLDVADDSTPFTDFMAKCRHAAGGRGTTGDVPEHGHGLRCILQMHNEVAYIPGHESEDGLNHFIVRDMLKPATRAKPLAASMPPPAASARKIVFLVDDNQVALDLHRRILEEHYTVHCFNRSAEVPAAFAQRRPDLVISDLHMPSLDGVALRRQLSLIEGGDAIPFIFLSQDIAGAHSLDVNRLGIDDFLCKPISAQRLLAVTARLIQRSTQFATAVHGKFNRKLTAMLHPVMPPRHEGWHIATRSHVAEAGGGDFILHHKNGDCMLAVIADIMGHGQEAKFFAFAYAGYLRSLMQLFGNECSPGPFLERVSNAVCDDSFLDSTMMTCLAFELAPDGGANVATAGHPPPYFITRDNSGAITGDIIDVSGPLPGLVAGNLYVQKAMQFRPGDMLVLATDGFFGILDRAAILYALSGGAPSAEDAADALWSAYEATARSSLLAADDATLIVLQYGDTP